MLSICCDTINVLWLIFTLQRKGESKTTQSCNLPFQKKKFLFDNKLEKKKIEPDVRRQ